MSSIKFEAGIDVSKLEEGLKQANQSFAEFSKNAVKSGQVVDQSFQKSTENLKQQVAQQKQLIKEIEADIKNMSAERDKMGRTQDKSNANVEISAAKRALAEENNRLLDLQKRQIEGNQNEEKSQGSLIGSLKNWALGLASVAAAMKVGKAIIESTEATAHVFEIGMNAASSATGVFFKTVASGDWGNFFSNMDQAIQGAVTYTNAMEDLKNRMNETKISNSELDIKIGKLRMESYAQNDDPVALKKTLGLLIAAQTEKYDAEAKIAKDTYDIKVAKIASDNSMNAKDIENTIKFYSKKKDVIEKGEEYNKLLSVKYQQGGGGGLTMVSSSGNENEYRAAQAQLKVMREEAAITGLNLESAGKLADEFSKVTFKERDAVAELLSLSNKAAAAGDLANRRDKQRAENLDKQIKANAEIGNRITELEKKMQSASAKELPILAEKLALLYREKNLWEEKLKLAKSVMSVTKLKGVTDNVDQSNEAGILTGFVSSISKSTSADVKSDQWEIDRAKLKMRLSDEAYQKVQKSEEFQQKRRDESEKQRKKDLKEVLNLTMDLTYEMAKQLGLSEDELKLLDETMATVSKALQGDYIGAAFSAMAAITDGLISLQGDFGASKRAEGIQKINDLLTEQNRIVEESVRKGQEVEKRSEELRLLKEKQIQLTKDQQSAEDALNNPSTISKLMSFIGVAGLLARAKQKKKLQEEIAATETEINAVNEQIRQAEQALEDLKVGGITENTLADAIAKGFQEGKTSVNDFADYMNQVLLDAVMNIFKGDILGDMQPLLAEVRKDLGDKKLTKEEKDTITAEAKRVADENQALWKDLTGSLNLGEGAKPVGMSGTIQRSITEATGTELAGLFRRNADDTRGIRDFTKLGVNHLMAIEANTGETVVQLKRAVVELQSVVSNTKIQYSGKIGG